MAAVTCRVLSSAGAITGLPVRRSDLVKTALRSRGGPMLVRSLRAPATVLQEARVVCVMLRSGHWVRRRFRPALSSVGAANDFIASTGGRNGLPCLMLSRACHGVAPWLQQGSLRLLNIPLQLKPGDWTLHQHGSRRHAPHRGHHSTHHQSTGSWAAEAGSHTIPPGHMAMHAQGPLLNSQHLQTLQLHLWQPNPCHQIR